MSAPRTFADLLAGPDPGRPLLVGADGDGDHGLALADLRRITARIPDRFPPGAAVMLARTPASPEAPLAGLLFALLAAGIRVYLPASIGDHTPGHLEHWRPAAIIGDRRRVPGFEAIGQQTDRRLAGLAARRGIPYLDLMPCLASLGWTPTGVMDDTPDATPRAPLADILCLTSSGTTGPPRALRYPESSWMACGAAFASAGLLTPDRLGGPTLCPGLCHSMGVRAAMLALWARAPIVFVQPEWPAAAPDEAARLLLAHPPRHITGGPALLSLLPAATDAEPALRRVVRGLTIAVSSGAPFDPRLAARLPHTRLANAFGTTETQQISTTLLDPDAPLETLGRPLPGVEWRVVDGALEVRSPFAAAGPLGAPDWPAWHRPGDRVTVDDAGRLRHAGRSDDCVSTGLGVELARGPVEARLRDLPGVERLVIATHPDCPGLLGLAFVGDRDPDRVRPALTDALRARAEAHPPQAPFDADRLWAVGLVPGHPPRIGPGKLDRRAIAADHRPLLDALADPERAVGIPLVDPDGDPHPAWPRRAPALAALGLDARVIDGAGDHLTVERGGARLRVLDVVGGFGVNLLGHRDPALIEVARAALDGVPICDQATARAPETDLCRALSRLLARHTDRAWAVALASTGAEAVDLALRHCLLRRAARIDAHHAALRARFGATAPARLRALIADNRDRARRHPPVIVTLVGGFHGMTLAARCALGDPDRRGLIAPLVAARTIAVARDAPDLAPLRAERIPLRTLVDGPDGPVEADWRPSNLLAVFAEAVQGEGGVRPIPQTTLDALGALDAPLVIDEIQAGLGRCGRLIAAGRAPAEVYLFGKALGGGLAKIAAVAIHRRHLQPGFDDARGSTFAGDAVGCRVAQAVIERIEADDVPGRAAAIGHRLGAALRRVADRWPGVIRAVRGRGLLFGVELARPDAADPIVRALAERGWGLVAASWLLHRHRIRALPTTGAPDVLRIEPSVHFDPPAIDRLAAALDALCATLASRDPAALLGPWIGSPIEPVTAPAPPTAPDPPARVAFLHPLQSAARALTRISPGLARLPEADRRRLLGRLLRLLPGAPLPAYAHALFDGRVLLDGLAICAPPAAFTLAHRRGEAGPLRDAVDAALALARDRGATVAVLGGLTSVVTDAGRAVLPPAGLRVVTGNTFTAAAVLDALPGRMRAAGFDPAQITLAIVGAAGNVGRAIARGIAAAPDGPGRLLLVGRPGSGPRLAALADALDRSPISTADDPRALADADVIIAAVNSAAPIEPGHLAADRPVLLIDVSAPSVIPPGLRRARPNVRIAHGARVALPRDPTVRLAGVGRPGALFACAAEGLLLALDPTLAGGSALIGPIDPAAVGALRAAGRRWGVLRGGP